MTSIIVSKISLMRYRVDSDGKKRRLIANDNKICRAVVEKRPIPKALNNVKRNTGGKIIIRPFKRDR
jgi:hypothetical protein